MSERLKSMQRIVAMQAQRKRLAEWKLAEIETRKAAVKAAQAELGRYMETADLTGPLAGVALKQTRRLAEREAETEAERNRQQEVLQAAQRRHRLAERVAEAAALEDRMIRERRDLEVSIEEAVTRAAAADPPEEAGKPAESLARDCGSGAAQ